MGSPSPTRASSQAGFIYTREYHGRPELPPGYDWPTQIKKYCPFGLGYHLEFPGRHKFGHVFCHRGFYDLAKRIPENSNRAIMNGIEQGLLLHEVDARMGDDPAFGFLAHDESARRITSKDRHWSSLNHQEILDTKLVTRRFNVMTNDFASSYQETQESVARLEDQIADGVDWDHSIPKEVKDYLLRFVEEGAEWIETLETCFRDDKVIDKAEIQSFLLFLDLHVPGDLIRDDGRCLQLDLRNKDLPKAVVYFQEWGRTVMSKVLLKGYNFEYASYKDLETALNLELSSRHSSFAWIKRLFPRREKKFAWTGFPGSPYVIMVFYSKPLIALALKAKGVNDPDKATLEDRLNLDFQHIRNVVMEQVLSFIGIQGFGFIPEIAHSGLGLGYNIETGTAVSPWDGAPIVNPEVLLESRVDRAMIDVSLELRKKYDLYFSSCTRLCEVRKSGMEYVADIKTGRLKLKPEGEQGISTKLRSIHGGLYPQSDLVVADDPFAEIAARTWIDEYARLNRRQLLKKPYYEWLGQAGEDVVNAIKGLNGPFLSNTFA